MRRLLLWLAAAVAVAAIATLARLLVFYAQFDSSWPAMFCYGPEGAFMFEAIAGVPLLAVFVAWAVAITHNRGPLLVSFSVAIVAASVCAFLLMRAWNLVDALTGHQYDEGCGRAAEWAWQYPLLNLVTQPRSAVGVLAVVVVATGAVFYMATRPRVA